MLLIGIDVETSGLEPKSDRIIEIGACLLDWDTKMPMMMLSELVDPKMENEEFKLPEEITALTGITEAALEEFGGFEKDVLAKLDAMAVTADFYVGHNANVFDRLFLEEAYRRNGMTIAEKPWVDTICDIKFDPSIKTRNLQYLAADHGFVSPFRHRALFDVLAMLKILGQYDLDAVIARAAEPTLYVQAVVSFDEKEKAKELGFRWFAPDKIWWRSQKSSDYEAMKSTCGFKTRLLAGPLE